MVASAHAHLALAQNGQPVITPVLGHSNFISAVAISRDGQKVLTGSGDQTLKLWQARTGQLLRTVKVPSTVTSVAISPDGQLLAAGTSDTDLRMWRADSGELVRLFQAPSQERKKTKAVYEKMLKHDSMYSLAIAFSPDGQHILAGGDDKMMRLWEVATGKLLLSVQAHADGVATVAFSPDGKTLLTGAQQSVHKESMLKLWSRANGSLLKSFPSNNSGVEYAVFSRDGHQIVTAANSTVSLWSAQQGTLLKTFEDMPSQVVALALSPDDSRILVCTTEGTLIQRNVQGGENASPISTVKKEQAQPGLKAAAFNENASAVLTGGWDNVPKLWTVSTGQLQKVLDGRSVAVWSVAMSADGTRIVSGGDEPSLRIWDSGSGQILRTMPGHAGGTKSVAVSPDGRRILSVGNDGLIKIWDAETASLLKTITAKTPIVNSAAFSPDGRYIVAGGGPDDPSGTEGTLTIWATATGEVVREFEIAEGEFALTRTIKSVAFSPDGAKIISGGQDLKLKVWDVASGKAGLALSNRESEIAAVAISPDGKRVVSASFQELTVWDAASGALLKTLKHPGWVMSVTFSPDGKQILTGGEDHKVRVWQTETGRLVRTLEGHSGTIRSVAVSADGARIVSGSEDTMIKIWNANNGDLIATFVAGKESEWLSMAKEGFFAASKNGAQIITVVRDVTVTTIGQVHQALFNPDLLRQKLAGDPDGEVSKAAAVVDLSKVLDSGSPPSVAILPLNDRDDKTEVVTIQADITDNGKGIGRIEWRVNGITAAVTHPQAQETTSRLTQQLALDPGANAIEVIAYNGANLLASVPATAIATYEQPSGAAKPLLHVLAVGINTYVDQGWTEPGTTDAISFPPLSLAANDAHEFAAAIRKAGEQAYESVQVTELVDEKATREGLEKALQRLANDVRPQDTFILYVAAHGVSENGRFYLIPQDYQSGPRSLQGNAIGQDQLQDWIANRIKARKALLLLDTCESGALVSGATRTRIGVPASETAVGLLHEATGRPVLTAAAEGRPAFEGFESHGVFTWSVLDALKHGDLNDNGTIELSELAAHVQNQVPLISAKLNGRGRAAIATRGSSDSSQSARFGSRGEDYSLVRRLP